MLNELDKELEARGLHFVRYADDCVIAVGSSAAANRVMRTITKWIEKKLALTAKGRAEYSIIGINKIDSMLRTPNCRLREGHLSATIILQ